MWSSLLFLIAVVVLDVNAPQEKLKRSANFQPSLVKMKSICYQ